MTDVQLVATRRLVEGAGGDVEAIAARAARACEQLAHHLARLVGELGIRTLVDRALHLAAARYSFLAPAIVAADPYAGLQAALVIQPADTAIEAFVLVIVTFVGLLERMIGRGLVTRLLHEVWPAEFPAGAEETT